MVGLEILDISMRSGANIMPKLPEKKDLLANRKKAMREAWYLDRQTNVSPLHHYWRKEFGKTWEWALADPPHHLLSRDNSGKHDGVEFLITLNRLEHRMCELGCKPLKLTGKEYEFLILWLLAFKPNNRWTMARIEISRKIPRERLTELIKLAETLV